MIEDRFPYITGSAHFGSGGLAHFKRRTQFGSWLVSTPDDRDLMVPKLIE
jgi:hypothetical protein